MIVALIVVGCLLSISMALNFLLWKVLKNTFLKFILEEDNNYDLPKVAYDNKYYPCNLFVLIKFDSKEETLITDFSLYKDYKIIGYELRLTGSKEEYFKGHPKEAIYKDLFSEDNDITSIIPNVIVYSPMEGLWTWKEPD